MKGWGGLGGQKKGRSGRRRVVPWAGQTRDGMGDTGLADITLGSNLFSPGPKWPSPGCLDFHQ